MRFPHCAKVQAADQLPHYFQKELHHTENWLLLAYSYLRSRQGIPLTISLSRGDLSNRPINGIFC
jgi:hypothetical protein